MRVRVQGYELKGAEGRGGDLGPMGKCGNLCSGMEGVYHGFLRRSFPCLAGWIAGMIVSI